VRVLRPQDASEIYAQPRSEFARLVRTGVLHRLATGYYAHVPDDRIDRPWLPELEAVALGIAAADEGIDSVALMGLSAARVHGALPRAVSLAVVAASHHRAPIKLTDRDATVIFVRRNVAKLDVERHTIELGHGWVTTVEQTALDLAARPDLGGLPDEACQAIRVLLPRADRRLLAELAASQRRKATMERLFAMAENA
jgi:hypothetical protein